jgi:hypothetical protein
MEEEEQIHSIVKLQLSKFKFSISSKGKEKAIELLRSPMIK